MFWIRDARLAITKFTFNGKPKPNSRELQQKLIEAEQLFRAGVSRTKIARMVKVNDNILVAHLENLGLKAVNSIYRHDDTVFASIDTEERAYWLGFLYADGNVTSSVKYALELTLKAEDRGHLEKFKAFLKSDVPIVKRVTRIKEKEFISYRIAINNKKMVTDLIRHGCVPRKSLVLEFPKHIPDILIPSFIRGYFDGDGCIYVGERYGQISLVGTSHFLQDVRCFLNLPDSRLHKKGNAYSFIYGRKNVVIPFLEAIYKEAGIYLDRKYVKYQKLIQILHPNPK